MEICMVFAKTHFGQNTKHLTYNSQETSKTFVNKKRPKNYPKMAKIIIYILNKFHLEYYVK